MKTRTLSTAFLAGAIALFATAQANATTVVVELVNPGIVYPNYIAGAGNPVADSTTGTVQQNIVGSVPGTNRSPFDLPSGAAGPTTGTDRYTSVQGGASATFNIGTISENPAALGLAFLWGSPDNFNNVEFFNGATSLGSVSSLNLINPNGNPPQTNGATGQSWVVVLAGGTWTSVVFSSTTNAFEFASLQSICSPEGNACVPFSNPVPLPAALPLFAGGLGFLGFLARRKKQKAA